MISTVDQKFSEIKKKKNFQIIWILKKSMRSFEIKQNRSADYWLKNLFLLIFQYLFGIIIIQTNFFNIFKDV